MVTNPTTNIQKGFILHIFIIKTVLKLPKKKGHSLIFFFFNYPFLRGANIYPFTNIKSVVSSLNGIHRFDIGFVVHIVSIKKFTVKIMNIYSAKWNLMKQYLCVVAFFYVVSSLKNAILGKKGANFKKFNKIKVFAMTNRDESPVTPLAEEPSTSWADAEKETDLQNNKAGRTQIEDNDDENEKRSTPDLTLENWRSVLNDSDNAASQLIPYLEAFALQNGTLKREVEALKEKLRESKSTHRGSIFALHNKMLQKLLVTEQEHEDNIEINARKMAELEKKVHIYEEIDRGADINKTLQTFFTQEKQHLEKIQELERTNRDLEEALKIEQIKVEGANSERRQSMTTLQDQMLKRLMKAEEESESTILTLRNRIEELENQVSQERFKTEEMDKSRRASISTLHSNMTRELLDARSQHEQAKKEYNSQIKELKQQIKYLELQNSTLKQESKHSQVSYFIFFFLCIYEKEVQHLKYELKRSQEEASQCLTFFFFFDIAVFNLQCNFLMNGLVDTEEKYGEEINSMRAKVNTLEEEKKQLTKQMHAEEHKRKASNAELSSSMFQKVLFVEQEKELEKIKYELQIQDLQKQLEELKTGGPRRASEIHKSMFTSLLEAEEEYNTAKKDWEQQELKFKNDIQLLMNDKNACQHEIALLKKYAHDLEISKLEMVDQCNRQLNFLRDGIRVLGHK
ncbi:hypothetical protein RFI_24724 [Reticulomyxa filosa]|uniref:Viral A-type inclusion protein n=1 Tax=Reticulomyxa filosa TaxID=46433 RepID=X6MF55_RETFI|nr:hypothetical protein RFI_24724 [Reticulomyxa filosa]|eukprot:ETO12653.1 hypothetical protein RFI_24724 [Reticulomyxa filosa]